jgi:hypothetical protein
MPQISVTFDPETPLGRALLAQLLPGQSVEPIRETLAQQVPGQQTSAETKANRQAAAAAARAAKAAKTTTQTPVDSGDNGMAADLGGPPAGTNGQDQEPEEDLGLDDPSMSPTEARDKGLAVVREIYAAGKVAEVKALQKEYAVAKFYDVPEQQGHAFYRRVMEVAHAVGLRA